MITMMRHEISSRPVVLRDVAAGEKLAKVIVDAGVEFAKETGKEAQVAFVADIPAGVEEGKEVRGIMLIQADWVAPGQVAVCAGGLEVIDDSFKKWRKV